MKTDAVASTPDYPKKLFYRIKEVAEIARVRPHVLRYWESEFPELAPEKDGSDQRRYRQRDIDTVLAIRKLLYEDGFTIRGARGRLKPELCGARDANDTDPNGQTAAADPSGRGGSEGRNRDKGASGRTDAPSHRSIGFHLLPQTRARARRQALRRDLEHLKIEVADLLMLLEK